MKRILVLYKELAGYFVACLDHLCQAHDVQADVVAYPVNSDAPFQFQHSSRIHIHSRKDFTTDQLCKLVSDGNYDLVFVGGWFDKDYLTAIQGRKCPALLGFDNQWNGSMKHQLSALYGRFFIQPKFDYAFVPGAKQVQFAKHLGFNREHIITGAYSSDVPKFLSISRQSAAPKRLIYAGRYATEKFVTPLFESFLEVKAELQSNWELHAIGTGPLWQQRVVHENIHHHGFMQPDDLLQFMAKGDAFVLPSTFEPWGVVVHEFASAGYPLLLSNAVGAAEAFLQHEKNGFLFEANQKEALKTAIRRLMQLNDDALSVMGSHSRLLAQSITPETWAASLYRLMK